MNLTEAVTRCPVCASALEGAGPCATCDHELVPLAPGRPAFSPSAAADEALVAAERRHAVTRIGRDLLPLGATDAHLLEVGASTGALVAAAKAAGYAPRGIEADARRRELAARYNAVELEGELEMGPFTAGSAGVVVLSGALASVADPAALLDAARHVLVASGILVAAVPVGTRAFPGAADHGRPGDRHRFSPTSLARLVRAAGFSLLDLHSPDGAELIVAGTPA